MPDSSSFCFIHAADLHLDTPFKGVHEVAPFVAAELREASLAAFASIVDLALERRAAFLLVAGDVYDGAERGLRAQLRFASGLGLLAGEGIPSFVVHGNHDPIGQGWSALADWPKGVKIFGADEPEIVPVLRDGAVVATVQGISYATAETKENLALRLRRPEGPGLHVGLLHCNVGGDPGHDNYSPCSVEDLAKSGLDYFALGHIHARRVVADRDGMGFWAVYAGNSQARSPKPSERGAKGAVVVHVESGRVEEVEFVACDRVRFAEIDCQIDDINDDLALQERLAAMGRDAFAASDGRSVVLRACLSGRGPIHADLARPGALEAILSELRRDCDERRPFLWWDEIVDATSSSLDFDEIRSRNDFVGDLLRTADETNSRPELLRAVAERLVGTAPRSVAAALERMIADPLRLEAVGAKATTTAIDVILEEAS